MLKRIARVDDFRAMRAWSSSVEFQNINLVYGSNGSGKSTLASLFEEYVRNPEAVGAVRVEIIDGAEQEITLNGPDDYFWANVRVFNRNYVTRNMHFDGAAGPDANALMTLGERQIEAEGRRSQIQDRLDEIANQQPQAQRELDAGRRSLDQLVTRTAQQIGQELQVANNRYNPRTYRAPILRALLSDRAAISAGASASFEQDLTTVTMPAMTAINALRGTVTDLTGFLPELTALLRRTATSEPIPQLADKPTAEHWVQEGLAIHDDANDCYFCGGTLDPDRRAALGRHFDASLVALQRDLAALKGRIASALDQTRQAYANLPVANLLLESLRESYATTTVIAGQAIVGYADYGAALVSLLDGKATHLFTQQTVGQLPAVPDLDLGAVADIADLHDRQLLELSDMRSQAASRIECSRALAIVEEVDGYQAAVDASQRVLDGFASERDALIAERDALPTSELDPLPLAATLNSDLAYLLGRDELKFAVNGERYEIQRSGEPARHLSEGERTAISLLYFLSSLEGHDVDPTKLTVFIDDPVSSLDSSVLVGASSHLWRRLVESTTPRQVFILTHNFDLFRMWSNQFDRRRRAQIRSRPGGMYELRMKAITAGGATRRAPVLSEWPADANIRKRIRSEYHYLFWRLAQTLEESRVSPSIERDIDAAAILPNVARRVLEGFLAFKYPEMIDDFEGAVTRANERADPATQQRIVRFLHQYSHNGEADTSRGVPRPEAVTVLTSVFDLMKAIDPDHLSAMCAALDIEEIHITSPSDPAT